jgi:hypothetical protein
MRYFSLGGTGPYSYAVEDSNTASYSRWHRTRSPTEGNFATSSSIRAWTDGPTKAA